MRELLGIELSDEEFDAIMCQQSSGKEIKIIDGKIILVEPQKTPLEHEQVDTTVLDMAETMVALNERIAKLEGGK